MDYDKLIERLNDPDCCDECTYEENRACAGSAKCVLSEYSAAALSTLRAENEKMQEELARVTEERDAAINDLEHLMLVVNSGECCKMCKHDHEHLTGPCAGQSTRCDPKWRGIKED